MKPLELLEQPKPAEVQATIPGIYELANRLNERIGGGAVPYRGSSTLDNKDNSPNTNHLAISKTEGLSVDFGGKSYNSFEGVFRPGNVYHTAGWLGHFYLKNGQGQIRFDINNGQLLTAAMQPNGRWTRLHELSPERYQDLRDSLKTIEQQLNTRDLGEVAVQAA